MEVSLIIPCFNEEGNIENLVKKCEKFLSNNETIASRWRTVATRTDFPLLGGRARIDNQNFSKSIFASPLQQVQL